MVLAASLSTLLALAIAIAAKPVLEQKSLIKLALTKRHSLANFNVVERDLRRANLKFLKEQDDSGSGSENNTPITNLNNYLYNVTVGVGDPPTNYNLQLDSGSAITWIGANIPYKFTKTSQKTHNTVFRMSATANFSGSEFIDQVTIGPGLVITNQSIGVATKSSLSGVSDTLDGVLGIGPAALTVGSLFPDDLTSIPTVTDNLFSSGKISENLVALSFEPFNTPMNETEFSNGEFSNGEMTWGGIDSSKFIGNITYTHITSSSPANNYWGIDANATYGLHTPILSTAAGIVDTGSVLLLLATNAFDAYVKATGAVFDNSTQFLTITSTQFGQLQDLSFSVSGVNFTLTADAQIWPLNRNTLILGGVANKIYLIVGNLGNHSGYDFIFGMQALERFYTVLDTTHKQVGLAYTPFTNTTSNNITSTK